MNQPIHALLIGDYTDAPWHPLGPAEQALRDILPADFRLSCTEDYNVFAELNLGQAQLCISYTDCWSRQLTAEQTAGLLRYVAGGGGLLILHNGISIQVRSELAQLAGAKFTGHPPYQALRYFPTAAGHALTAGVEPFAMDEEPYMFDWDPFVDKTVVLEFEFAGARYPAAWEHAYGLGRVVYLQPGHHAPSFQSAAYRRMVQNAARWAAGAKPDS